MGVNLFQAKTQALEQDTEHSKDMIGVTSSYITELRTKML